MGKEEMKQYIGQQDVYKRQYRISFTSPLNSVQMPKQRDIMVNSLSSNIKTRIKAARSPIREPVDSSARRFSCLGWREKSAMAFKTKEKMCIRDR